MEDLNKVVAYIEEHLQDEISIDEMARNIGVSEYHLKRTFSFIFGMSIFEYIKKRRLSLANEDLVNGKSVTEVAFKYRYQSVEGFSRAFQEWIGKLPSKVKSTNIYKSFPKLEFNIEIRGGNSMEFKIEEKEAFNIVGVSKNIPIQFEGENNAIIELAQSLTSKQKEEMNSIGDLYPEQVVNVSYNWDKDRLANEGQLTHMLGLLTRKENIYEDLEEIQVPKNTWAIFPNKGKFPDTLQQTMADVFSEWLPSSGYELVEAPEISFTRWEDNLEEVYSEIWIAVKKK